MSTHSSCTCLLLSPLYPHHCYCSLVFDLSACNPLLLLQTLHCPSSEARAVTLGEVYPIALAQTLVSVGHPNPQSSQPYQQGIVHHIIATRLSTRHSSLVVSAVIVESKSLCPHRHMCYLAIHQTIEYCPIDVGSIARQRITETYFCILEPPVTTTFERTYPSNATEAAVLSFFHHDGDPTNCANFRRFVSESGIHASSGPAAAGTHL